MLYALLKYEYEGLIVELLMTSGLPPHSYSYWVVHGRATPRSTHEVLTEDMLEGWKKKELNNLVTSWKEKNPIKQPKRIEPEDDYFDELASIEDWDL